MLRYHVGGMDCGGCASKIERALKALPGVSDVKVSIASQVMTVAVTNAAGQADAERTVGDLGYRLSALNAASNSDDGPNLQASHAHKVPGYRRALWIVVALNVGYGAMEIVAGFVAESQALKADALDFIGDGLITFLGLLAIGWSLVWRARSALLQGIFLGLLGCGVLASTAYRVLVLSHPTAEIMGLFGAIALVVNLLAALVLLPHRSGDANVRAVWLFSRNDAIGNLAVVAAAGLVYWSATPWPDLVVAVFIAGLFLHSAWRIVSDAQHDLAHASGERRH